MNKYQREGNIYKEKHVYIDICQRIFIYMKLAYLYFQSNHIRSSLDIFLIRMFFLIHIFLHTGRYHLEKKKIVFIIVRRG